MSSKILKKGKKKNKINLKPKIFLRLDLLSEAISMWNNTQVELSSSNEKFEYVL